MLPIPLLKNWAFQGATNWLATISGMNAVQKLLPKERVKATEKEPRSSCKNDSIKFTGRQEKTKGCNSHNC